MPTRIIFLCPHNAAKSVFAAAFLAREAAERGLDVEITTAGTDPDPDILPIVRTRLETEGLPIDEGPPRTVTEEDLAVADVIVNIGCSHDELPTSRSLREWHVPNFSDDPEAAFAALQWRVTDLATALDASS